MTEKRLEDLERDFESVKSRRKIENWIVDKVQGRIGRMIRSHTSNST